MTISEKVGFGASNITRDKEVHFIIIWGSKGSYDHKYAPNKKASKYMNQKLRELQGETNKSTL